MSKRIYIGRLDYTDRPPYEIFHSAKKPTENSHPFYSYAIGPFDTILGARILLEALRTENPHVTTVKQAEAQARRLRAERPVVGIKCWNALESTPRSPEDNA